MDALRRRYTAQAAPFFMHPCHGQISFAAYTDKLHPARELPPAMRLRRPTFRSLFSSFVGRVVLIGALSAFAPVNSSAAPAAAGLAELTQPDGTRIRATLAGDEWFNWNETEDGYVIGKDTDGRWKYRRARHDRASFDFVPGAVVGKVNPAALGLRKRDLPHPALIRERVRALRGSDRVLFPARRLRPSPDSADQPISTAAPADGFTTSAAVAEDNAKPGPSAIDEPSSSATSPVASNIRCVVILAAFDDHWDITGNAPLASRGLPRANYDALFNQAGYSADGAVGSARDYYREVSYDRTDITFIVSDWVRLPQNEAYYGDNANEVAGAGRARVMAADAVVAADNAGFDFTQGDGNADGWVDMLVVIHSGYSEAHPGNSQSSLWPRQWSLPSVDTRDGKKLNAFASTSAMRGLQSSAAGIMRIGTLVHEIGHLFGLPDLYDLGGVTKGIGAWGLMGYGGWGASGGAATEHRPTHMEAFSKMILGYLDPEPVHTCNEHALPRLATSPSAHVLRASAADEEYFLIENRGGEGFDSGLPSGLLITHIDSRVLTVGNNSAAFDTPAIRVEEADGGDTLRTFGGTNASHVWTASNGLAGGFRDNTGDPHTNAMRYQPDGSGDFVYTRNIDPAFFSAIVASNFSPPGATMTYRLQTPVPTLASPPATTGGYTLAWSDSSDAERYELQEGTPLVASTFHDDAESLANMREQWEISGAVSRSSLGNATPGGSSSYELAGMLPGPDGVIHTSDDYYMPEHRGLTLRMSFALTSSTVVNFKYLSQRDAGRGPLRVQLTADNGVTWTTLGTYEGYAANWTAASINYSQLQSAGFTAGDICRLRFITTVEQLYGWNNFPAYGFALDDIELTGVSRDATAWTTISDNLTATEYTVSGKSDQSAWRYRVRAHTNIGWQDWSSVAAVDVNYSPLALWRHNHFGTTENTGDFADTADYDRDRLANLLEYALNGSPVSATDTPTPAPHVANNRLHLTFLRARADITYTIEASSDLESWTVLATNPGTVSLDTPVTVSDTVDLSTQPRRFLRLRVAY